jgi:hypothetical protein
MSEQLGPAHPALGRAACLLHDDETAPALSTTSKRSFQADSGSSQPKKALHPPLPPPPHSPIQVSATAGGPQLVAPPWPFFFQIATAESALKFQYPCGICRPAPTDACIISRLDDYQSPPQASFLNGWAGLDFVWGCEADVD